MAIRVVPSEKCSDVFINFRGKELRGSFISHLVAALNRSEINYHIDRDELRGEPLEVLFRRIEQCKIALTIFSSLYGESNWCLNELGKIMRRVEEGKLKVIPIFFNVTPGDVRIQVGEFGTKLLQGGRYDLAEMVQWRKDLNSVVEHMGMELSESSDEHTFIAKIITEVNKVLKTIRANSMMHGKITPPQIQVFINFPGDQLCRNFVGYLMDALQTREVNVFIDKHDQRGEEVNTLFKRIEDSGIAIVVFSTSFTESKWCLEELVKIKERVNQGLLKVLPIFYKVSPADVNKLEGEFGDQFRDKGYDSPQIKAWKEAIVFVTQKHALVYDENSGASEIDFVETIVTAVLEMLQSISTVESGQSSC